MVNIAVVGLGKMGISHLSIINAHPDVNVSGVCDSSGFLTGCMGKVADFRFFSDFDKMLDAVEADGVLIATPSSSHAVLLEKSLERGLSVFVEKPFTLRYEDSRRFAALAEEKGVVNQVGYHNKFVGAFRKAKELLEAGAIGEVYNIRGEAYGPVVLKQKGSTWRTKKSEGGGCLHDYASHVVDLMNHYVGSPSEVRGTQMKTVFSKDVEDAVFSSLFYGNGLTGQLSVNWSEPTYRKMSTSVTLQGREGKIVVDRQECKVFLRRERKDLALPDGWTVLYTTELTEPVGFYLRGEEYSAQIDHFVSQILGRDVEAINTFASAAETDRVIRMLGEDGK